MAQYQEKHLNNEEKMHALQNEVEDAKMELNRSRQREKMSEEHNIRLTQTVDKLLAESNERLQVHLNERMNALEEKNSLTQDMERHKKQSEELEAERDKAVIEIERLKLELETNRKECANLHQKMKELSVQYSSAVNLNNSLSSTINNLNKNQAMLNNGVGGKLNGMGSHQEHLYADQMAQAENGMNGIDLNGLSNSIYLSQQQLHHHHMTPTLPSSANKSPSFSTTNSLRKQRPMPNRLVIDVIIN